MKKSIILVLVLALSVIAIGSKSSPATAKETNILEFGTMVGVPQALTGSQNPIRNINGGGIPWTISSGSGELKSSGKLEISVQGLVLASGSNVGRNPSPFFRAIVSCLDGAGNVVNRTTDPFPATTGLATEGGGNAKFETTLSLPQPCIAPIIFVTSQNGAWFAATGQ